jgi:hypothetical protein
MPSNPENQSAHFSTHLSDEQFSDLLLGSSLNLCAQCSEEADRVSGAIGNFEQQTRLWAERRASAQPALVANRHPAFAWITGLPAWSTTAALAIALAAGIGLSHRANQPQPVQQQTAQTQPAAVVPSATLKADNDLLSAIDGELRADDSTPAAVYGLTVSHSRTRAPKRIANE